ncbi:hypothetical protein GP486_004650 [Trichoglossum hirsutum]|uniref:WD40 repeat-like protein n=1 Tax=Trichoglossum hirsutum TaxID=265104 RepID=A0A9P8LAS1_9PEZI|nr:hypothetical protein GP486_004650 [Trichoglossum hirsutum]
MEKRCERFKQVVGPIAILFKLLPATVLAEVIDVEAELVKVTLRSLHSVLDVPESQDSPIRLLHPSFRDFLLDEQRCSDHRFWVYDWKAHTNLAESCLRLMSKNLRSDICGLHIPGTLTSDVESSRVRNCLPVAVQYACCYWVGHLRQGDISLCGDNGQVHIFLREHFLHWLEALSLMGKISEGVLMLTDLLSILKPETNLPAMVYDAKRFTLNNRSIIEKALLQTYNSALVFSPKRSIIRGQFLNQFPKWINSLPVVDEDWNPMLQTLEGHSGSVRSVKFSPDGAYIASGSEDHTVVLWDVRTCTLQSILRGHSGWVQSVAFSPDGARIASGSNDRTVILWDAKTGTLQSILKGHSGWVLLVVFSPDSAHIASGSDDHTVMVWDAKTSALQSTLKGHSGWVQSVAFSPDGTRIASGSGDHTVTSWDAKTGTLQSTLKSYLDAEAFVRAFSCSLGGGGQWVTWNMHNVLFLPHDRRPTAFTVRDNTLAIGHLSGRVSILEFDGNINFS